MSKTFNVIKISRDFCQQAASERSADLAQIVANGRVFAAESLNLHPELDAKHQINASVLKKMWGAAIRITYHAHVNGFKGVVLPHEQYSERGQMINEAIAKPLGRHYGLNIRLQRGICVVDDASVDPRVRTCLEQGAVRVLRVNSDIFSLKRSA